jgi:hypothetical protein
VFSVVTSVEAVRIARERDRANEEARAKEQIAGFLKQLFQVSNPGRARGNTVTAREILDEGVKEIDLTLADQPALRAELMSEMGEVYESLGLYVEGKRLKRQAVALRRQALGPDQPIAGRAARHPPRPGGGGGEAARGGPGRRAAGPRRGSRRDAEDQGRPGQRVERPETVPGGRDAVPGRRRRPEAAVR